MKTIHFFPRFKTSLLSSLAFLLIAALPLSARILPAGIGVKTGLSGNGLRSSPSLTVQFESVRWGWELAANVQLKNTHLSGVQSTLYYYPMRTNFRGLRLGFFNNVRYNFASGVNKSVIAQETFLQPENRVKIDEVLLSTVESQMGFVLRVYHNNCISTFYGIGMGVYHTLGGRADYALVHREFTHSQLVLNVGINFDLRRKL